MIQLAFDGLFAGSVYALVGLGFALIYNTARFFHFAHGAVYTAGAYFTLTFYGLWKLPFFLSVALAILLTALVGVGIETVIYRPMRHQRASPLVLLIASLGMLIIVQNLISLVYGNDTKSIRSGFVQEGHRLLGARVTTVQLTIFFVGLFLFIITGAILKRTATGRALRAVANDAELASIIGVNTDRILCLAYLIGSALAAVAAILISLDTDMTPVMGFKILLYAVVAVIIGGVDTVLGVYLGGLLLGLTQQAGAWLLTSEWQDAITFVFLIMFLLFRPQGFLGRPLRKASI